ncbi:hypothetical protein NSK11_contig00047-0046 [Nocardia seriolae]|uniref:Uncharacterized protein n=1 Tax=Nocardia seriolae TaxID=37332 RepID=A0ABC9YUR0_9NOCA|nr:hypothetical protein NSERKGN1266_06990 [Nocardia seriolae]BEK92703.1 hypothetical protein NSER024013_06090 [Nocardia seriolae]GAM47107.1 hypothetical protein NS07_v2contig00043-0046 [Nocardia seriolae]GAP29013.1 hypothetical protein NSK11_contig00047-0046 [Nocardia seriolae]GEM24541.1 hypothetical protein NS2_27800 [Nocardia seriolae NBRC 15557]
MLRVPAAAGCWIFTRTGDERFANRDRVLRVNRSDGFREPGGGAVCGRAAATGSVTRPRYESGIPRQKTAHPVDIRQFN